MTKPSVFITGINSFVGSHLGTYLKEKGFVVKGSLSNLSKSESVKSITTDLTELKLGPSINALSIPEQMDVVIYAAHDKINAANNIESNKKIYELASSRGCQYHIFISSISANPTNITDYGQVKLELEEFFSSKSNTAVVRPGLVIGEGGLYQNMENFVQKNSIVPLPDGGKYPMAIVEMNELAQAFEALINKRSTGFFNLYKPELITLKQIVKNIARLHGKKVFIITIPIDLTMMFFSFFKKILNLLRIMKNFNIDSVAGYKLYKDMKLPPSDLRSLLGK